MDLGLKGRRALVMGGTKGLGRSIADALAAEGAAVVISGRDQGRLDQAAAELKAKGAASAAGVVADVARGEDMDRLAEAAIKAMGGVDILVLNHGGPPPCTASQITDAALAEWFQHIVASPIRIANRLIPPMRERGWGRVIVVGSTGMQHPIPTLALSNTLRASIWGWLKTFSGEVAKDGVTMNILAPGTILTDRVTQTTTVRAQQRNISFDDALAEAAAEIPAGRLGTPDDYGPMGAFLASEKGAYITGSMIRVDGGRVRGMV
ncbi:SDR family oxidoreductase [Paracraurococcus ruber]|uniref:3-oxoacyl-ACP reductase n=1 Tax=Paracraurococcus ruber TaxID=77675 RepID=A0ABS1CX13_9PROT|nr:SDR family oxidoreductase [Paracraurococcus ruber]MBK1659070.1 3-oxoacyl-ACP reductase [Paracraurococcus ruber]TDG32265.1 SDR family oxidoreductase [Paracraurococcus ruber]